MSSAQRDLDAARECELYAGNGYGKHEGEHHAAVLCREVAAVNLDAVDHDRVGWAGDLGGLDLGGHFVRYVEEDPTEGALVVAVGQPHGPLLHTTII